ncbi:hypothetical protein H5P28_04680 [Ruficoccus amylovorans]|uniref:Uncharacterized protein n=1 Tax=Ruficoccus amylovorans TaxID=1804625 RepID=A0A842HDX6_9BACT|nr:hypothetical protein [Ruficoccus amylovorans]MBC2593551.1 hypothetical protein [Ruficoccus amylovorans]
MPSALTDRITGFRPFAGRIIAAGLLLSLPVWSGCFTPEPATITDSSISNAIGGSLPYSVDIPRGYKAIHLPEYLPHVAYTPEWLRTEEAAAFAGLVQTQALEQKLRADLLLYRRPNYRAYYSTGGEDILLFPKNEAAPHAPSPFMVFTADCYRGPGGVTFAPLRQGSLSAFGTWAAGSMTEGADEVSVDTRSVLGRKWIWLTARFDYPFTPATANTSDTATDNSTPTQTPAAAESWQFLYVATLGPGDMLYSIQGWSRPADHKAMVEAVDEMINTFTLSRK